MKYIALSILFSLLSSHFSLLISAPKQYITIDLRDSLNRESYYTSVQVPDGNYRVTVTLGAKKRTGSTTVRAESRRLFIENEPTRKGETKTISFLVNKRTPVINDKERVHIKAQTPKTWNAWNTASPKRTVKFANSAARLRNSAPST